MRQGEKSGGFSLCVELTALAVVLWCQAAWSESVHGAQLPDGAQKVGENRYRAKEDFDAVIKYYKSVYPPATYPRKAIVSRPEVKAVHITNPSMKNFEGLNIYVANDEVRIYVIPITETKPVKKRGSDRPSRK